MVVTPHKLHGCIESYKNLNEIDFSIIPTKIKNLPFFEDDVFLGMQAMNVGIVDQLITQYEYALLREYNEIERTPDSFMAVSALSQMWIYSLYEVLRLWHERKRKFEELLMKGKIDSEVESMAEDPLNHTVKIRKRQMLRFKNDAEYREKINKVFNGIEEIYSATKLIRINLAKHCAPNDDNNKIIPRSPGYARINDWCGALDFELIGKNKNRKVIGDSYYTCLNHRDIADALRDFLVKFA